MAQESINFYKTKNKKQFANIVIIHMTHQHKNQNRQKIISIHMTTCWQKRKRCIIPGMLQSLR